MGSRAKVGQYRSVIGLRIDTSRVGEAQVFLTWGWVAIIVSGKIKEALARLGATGPTFTEVTGPSIRDMPARAREGHEGPRTPGFGRDRACRGLANLGPGKKSSPLSPRAVPGRASDNSGGSCAARRGAPCS